jgi:Peptidase family M28
MRGFAILAAVLLLRSGVAEAAPLAHEIASGLARLGPRPEGREGAQGRALALLRGAMERAGLREVRAVPIAGQPSLVNLEGVLPGRDGPAGQEIVLSAHYDTVAKSPGAGDDASGCGVAIAAAADLARTPLHHNVRVVLFDGEEIGLLGSRGWVEALPPARRERILADLTVEMVGWAGSAGPTIHTFPVRRAGSHGVAPGWLVHALLRSGEQIGWEWSMTDATTPFLAQLVLRSVRLPLGADSDSFLAKGIPAVALSDTSLLSFDPAYHKPKDVPARLDAVRLENWTRAVAATVRRLDALAGRPIPEDQYLVLFDRVWLRRDLLWIGFLIWVALVFTGRRPGRWRGATADDKARQQRIYLPGYIFRLLLLLALFLAPVFSVLLLPAALVALLPERWRRPRWLCWLWILVGLLPLLAWLGALAGAFALHLATWRAGFLAGWPTALLLLATFAAWTVMISRRGPRSGTVLAPPERMQEVES